MSKSYEKIAKKIPLATRIEVLEDMAKIDKMEIERLKKELEKVKNLGLADVVGRSEQLSLSDFRVGFQYEEYQMDSERYLNKGMIWVKKTYGINSPRLHKIQKLIDEGKLRKA